MRIEVNSFSKHISQALVNKGFFQSPSKSQMSLLTSELENNIKEMKPHLESDEEKNQLYKVSLIFLIHAISVIQGSKIEIISNEGLDFSKYFYTTDKIQSLNISTKNQNYKSIYEYAKEEATVAFSEEKSKGNERTRLLMRDFYGDRL